MLPTKISHFMYRHKVVKSEWIETQSENGCQSLGEGRNGQLRFDGYRVSV